MIKRLIVLVVLASVLRMTGLLPFESSDVAQLVPVQALVVSMDKDNVVMDGGECLGIGPDWDSAWQDLRRSANGHVFLRTADHVVLCGNAVSLLPQLIESEAIRPAASVCACLDEVPEAEEAAEFLSAHDGEVTLQQLRALQLRPGKMELPRLVWTQGGWRLDAKSDR